MRCNDIGAGKPSLTWWKPSFKAASSAAENGRFFLTSFFSSLSPESASARESQILEAGTCFLAVG